MSGGGTFVRQFVTRTVTLEKQTFEFVGWIEQISSVDIVSHVVADELVCRSDGTESASTCAIDGSCSVDDGVRLVLFYIRADDPEM